MKNEKFLGATATTKLFKRLHHKQNKGVYKCEGSTRYEEIEYPEKKTWYYDNMCYNAKNDHLIVSCLPDKLTDTKPRQTRCGHGIMFCNFIQLCLICLSSFFLYVFFVFFFYFLYFFVDLQKYLLFMSFYLLRFAIFNVKRNCYLICESIGFVELSNPRLVLRLCEFGLFEKQRK